MHQVDDREVSTWKFNKIYYFNYESEEERQNGNE